MGCDQEPAEIDETAADTTAVEETAELSLARLRGPMDGSQRASVGVRRAGVMVTTHSVYRLDGDRLVGTTVARYADAGADSVLVLDAEGTRVQ